MMDIHDYAELKRVSLNLLMDFTSDTNPLGPSNKAKNAIRKNIKFLGHHPDKKSRYLASLLCKMEHISEENILIGLDPAYVLHVLLKITAAKTALVPSPLSDSYRVILKKHAVRIIPFHLDGKKGFAFEAEKFIKTIEDVDCVIIPNPHNMVGTCLSLDDLRPIIEQATAMKKILVVDETLREFPGIPSPVHEITRSKTSIILRTFSAFHALTGFQLGYTMGSRELIQKIEDHLGHFPVNPLASAAAVVSLRDKGYKKRTLAYIDEEKCFIKGSLKDMNMVQCIDTPCNFLLLKLDENITGLRDAFLKRRILVEDFMDKNGSHYIRLPVKKHTWNARFIRTLKNIIGVEKPCQD